MDRQSLFSTGGSTDGLQLEPYEARLYKSTLYTSSYDTMFYMFEYDIFTIFLIFQR
jgi:hypothetical protein